MTPIPFVIVTPEQFVELITNAVLDVFEKVKVNEVRPSLVDRNGTMAASAARQPLGWSTLEVRDEPAVVLEGQPFLSLDEGRGAAFIAWRCARRGGCKAPLAQPHVTRRSVHGSHLPTLSHR